MKEIPLTKGHVALVDDADYEWLNQYNWHYEPAGCGYAARRIDNKIVLMHQFIMQAKLGQLVDHKNRNGLDNQRNNLRMATTAQNAANRDKPRRIKPTTSQFKGVYLDSNTHRWIAKIRVNRQGIHIGSFADEVEAARAYDAAACKYHGTFARLNFPEATEDHHDLLSRARQWGHLPSFEELNNRRQRNTKG